MIQFAYDYIKENAENYIQEKYGISLDELEMLLKESHPEFFI